MIRRVQRTLGLLILGLALPVLAAPAWAQQSGMGGMGGGAGVPARKAPMPKRGDMTSMGRTGAGVGAGGGTMSGMAGRPGLGLPGMPQPGMSGMGGRPAPQAGASGMSGMSGTPSRQSRMGGMSGAESRSGSGGMPGGGSVSGMGGGVGMGDRSGMGGVSSSPGLGSLLKRPSGSPGASAGGMSGMPGR